MKKLSLCLAIMLFIVSVPTAFAQNSEYENLILTVKNRIEVPEYYTGFENINKYENDGKTFYSFVWRTEDKEGYISASCDSGGDICSYSRHRDSIKNEYLKMDSENAKAAALEFIERTNYKLKGKAVLELRPGYVYDGLSFSVKGIFNGIEYYNSIGSITVGADMTVSSMNITVPDIKDEELNLISNDEAYKLYMDNIGIDTQYYVYSDYSKYAWDIDNTLISFPAYSNVDLKAIDAVTGEVIERNNRIMFAAGSNAAKEEMSVADAGASYNELTEAEKENIIELENLITTEEALKIIKERTQIDFTPKRTNLLNLGNKKYRYWFDNDICNICVNANNGDIISLYTYFEKEEDNTSVFKNYKLDDAQSAKKLLELLAPVDGAMYESEENDETHANFIYKTNGIKLNSATAHIYAGDNSYSFNLEALDRFKDIEYASPESFIPTSEMFADTDFVKLKYIDTKDGIKAAYIPDDFFINAVTGKAVNRRNEENIQNTVYTYSDIENHWVRTAAERLAYGGIGFAGGILNPDKPVTVKEAYDLLNNLYYTNYTEDLDESQALTRTEIAVILVDRLGFSKLAESDIFIQPYTDVTQNIGAVAILKGFGIIAADTDTFRPNDNITRAEFLQILYNTLLSQ